MTTRDEPFARRAALRAADLAARWEAARSAAGRLSAGSAQYRAHLIAGRRGLVARARVLAQELNAGNRWANLSGRTGARQTRARAVLELLRGSTVAVAWDAATFEQVLAALDTWDAATPR